MGIVVDVYRNSAMPNDYTLGGVSSRFNRLCVVNADGPFKASEDCPAVMLELGALNSVRLVSVADKERGVWTMFGGNYATTCDSRFSEAVEALLGHRFYGAVAIHDRVE